ncbi:OmpW/AlkL family protein [Microbulbifer zhoushanensis]|uniref:OmpW/AlkL family protein n=1 Tax=Microbulbifer zhoushanensis TaxID=2904254 RepID=UPI001F367072|nr:OmpW family outer membrane protein [Microbulbifer zhoushanensis]
MKMTRILTPLAIAVSAIVGAQQAVAGPSGYAPPAGPVPIYHAGTAVVRLGAGYVDPDSTSSNLRNPDIFPEYSGLKYDLDDNTTWQWSAMFMPIDHFSVEYGYVGESDHDLEIRRLGLLEREDLQGNRRNLGSLERTSSTLMVNWFPVCQESWVQPYIGFGAVYTDFDSVTVREPVNELLVQVGDAIGPGRVSVDDTWGWAGQIGIDIMFGRESNWLANAAVQYHDVETTSSLRYAVRGLDNSGDERTFYNTVRTDLDVDPWVFNLGIGYKF